MPKDANVSYIYIHTRARIHIYIWMCLHTHAESCMAAGRTLQEPQGLAAAMEALTISPDQHVGKKVWMSARHSFFVCMI